jgi:LysM repeat protein
MSIDPVESVDNGPGDTVQTDTSEVETPKDLPERRTRVKRVPPDQNDPVMQDSQRKCDECKQAISRGNRMKDIAFTVACLMGGLGGLAAIVAGVIITCNSFTNNNNTPTVPIGVDPQNVQYYYDDNGQIHVNVYVQKRPSVDVNVIIDENGDVTVNTDVKDEDVTDKNDQTTETPDKELPDTDVKVPEKDDQTNKDPENENSENDGSESADVDDPQNNNGSTDNSTDETIKPDEDTENGNNTGQGDQETEKPDEQETVLTDKTEIEIQALKEQTARIKQGQSRYSDSDTKYEIVWGDTLSEISMDTGYSVEFLAEYNNIQNPDLIIAGANLYFPTAP